MVIVLTIAGCPEFNDVVVFWWLQLVIMDLMMIYGLTL